MIGKISILTIMYRATDSNLMQHPIQGERKCSYVLHVTDTGAPAWWATWLVSKLYPPSLRHLTSYLKDLWIPSIMHRRVVEPVNRANIPSQLNVRYFIGFAVNQRQTNSIQWNEQLHVHNFIVTTLAVKHRHAKRARVIFFGDRIIRRTVYSNDLVMFFWVAMYSKKETGNL